MDWNDLKQKKLKRYTLTTCLVSLGSFSLRLDFFWGFPAHRFSPSSEVPLEVKLRGFGSLASIFCVGEIVKPTKLHTLAVAQLPWKPTNELRGCIMVTSYRSSSEDLCKELKGFTKLLQLISCYNITCIYFVNRCTSLRPNTSSGSFS